MSSRKNKKAQMQTALLPLGALAAGFGLASAALAQSVPAPAPEWPGGERALPIVRVKAAAEKSGKDDYLASDSRIGKGRQELRDIPNSITVLTERLIDDRNLDTMKEALKNTAGITFMAAEGGEEDIRLKGFPLQASGDIFVDSMRDPAFYERDTFFFDRMELLQGSASMLFGRGSTGGAVNLVSKQPQLLDQNELALTIGSHNHVRAVGDFNIRTGEGSALRVGTMLTKADNNGAGSALDKSGLAAVYRLGIGEADEFAFGIFHLDNRNGINYGLPWIRAVAGAPASTSELLPLQPSAYYGLASDYNDGKATQTSLTHTHRFGPALELVSKLRSARYERDQRASTLRFAPAALQLGGIAASRASYGPATVLNRGTQLKIQNLQTLQAQSDLSAKLHALGLTHELQAGVDLAQEDKQVFGARSAAQGGVNLGKPSTTIGRPDEGAAVDEAARVLRPTSAYTSRAVGVYAQDLLQLERRWKLLLGLRFDKVKGDYEGYAIPANAAGPQTSSHYRMDVSESSQRAAVLYQPNERMSFYFGGATSFNTSGDAYSLSAANANIPPEQAINLELGGKVDAADGRLSARFSIFRSTKLHERNTDPLVNLVTLSGKRHSAGIEANMAGRISAQWEVFASFMWLPVANIDAAMPGAEGINTRPSLTPRYSGSLWSTYQLTPKLRLGAGLNGRSGQQPNRNPGFYAPKFMTADLMAEYQLLQDRVSFKANLSNVGNKLYADSLYTGHYIPGPGRLFGLTGTVKF